MSILMAREGPYLTRPWARALSLGPETDLRLEQPNPVSRGFQLLDLALTFLLMALLLGVAVPFLNQLASQQKQSAACDQLVSALSKARSLAVSENLEVQVIAQPPDRYAIRTGGSRRLDWRRLPGGVRFSEVPRRPVKFHSRGTASPAGSYQLDGGLRIIVAVSGRIRWTRF